jgi:cell wall-associated NlpC family hydrolase
VTPLQLTKALASGQPAPEIKIGSPITVIGHLLSDALQQFSLMMANLLAGSAKSLWQSLGSLATGGLISDTGGGTVVPAVATSGDLGGRIAAQAQHYLGVPYRWGGADPSGWDCSGMVTYVLHHDLGLNLPDNGHTVSQSFLTWSGARTVPAEQCQAGDLICWITHIAIATGPTTGIGAQNPRQGTISGDIKNLGPGNGETYLIRRVLPQGGAAGGASSVRQMVT